MVDHTLEEVFSMIVDEFISSFAKTHNFCSLGQSGFHRNYHTIDHVLTLWATIEETRANKEKVYCCFVDFLKAFDIVLRHLLFQRLENLEISKDIISLVMTLYEQVVGQVRVGYHLSNRVYRTIYVK